MPVINGTSGDDVLSDQAGDDTINALAGDDRIVLTNGGYNVVYGGDGDDTLVWNGSGTFTFIGGAGRNTVDATGTSSGFNYTAGPGVQVWLLGSGSDNLTIGDIGDLTDYEINAGSGSDDVIVGAGDDILTGGQGSDVLHGNAGDDTYIWNLGDGYDQIRENGGGGDDVIQFGAGIAAGDITITYGSSDLTIRHVPSGYTIIVRDGNLNLQSVVETLRFAGGATIDLTQGSVQTGSTSSETLYGSLFDDRLTGDAGNDSLRGQSGSDILTGGAGTDYLYGLSGNDTYVWNLGDGDDYIYEQSGGGVDVLRFGSGILAADITYRYDGYDLIITHTPSGAVIRVDEGGRDEQSALERIRFADGSIIDLSLGLTQSGTSSYDSIYGSVFDDTLAGLDNGDNLYGGLGDDRLVGGTGSDDLHGGAGDDVYVWNIGDGTDYIDEDDLGGLDTIEFGAGITMASLAFSYTSSNLTITHTPSGAQLYIYGQAQYLTSVVELLRFSNGTTFDLRSGATATGDQYGNTLYGALFDDVLNGGGGNDTLYGDLGDDILTGGLGVDYVYGEAGDDTYVWNVGDGDDQFYEGSTGGDDTLLFGAGINAGHLLLTYTSTDLTVRHIPSGASLTFHDAAGTPGAALETIRFANGAVLDLTLGVDIAGGSLDETHYGSTFDDRIAGAGGADTLYGNHGDDTLRGDAGADFLYGDEGADILLGGAGIDNLLGGSGEDRLQGGSGDDVLDGGDGAGDWVWHEGETIAVQINLQSQTATGAAIGSDTLLGLENAFGSAAGDLIIGSTGSNIINGAAGDDTIRAGDGNDEALGGSGNDTVEGGAGNDRLYGDEPYTPTQTSTNTGVTTTGDPITISLTGARADPDAFTSVVGYVGARAPESTNINIVFVIDVSGSMSSTFQGDETVPDLDGDGYSNTLMDGAILGYTALVNNLIDTGLGSNRISIVAFDDLASIIYSGPANQDSDGDGVPDAIEALRTLRPGGSTYYDLGLQEAIEALQLSPDGDNYVFFESDGAPNGGPYLDEVETLLTTYNATIRALGLGNGASLSALDLVDDGIANNSAERVLTPSTLTAGLLNPDIDPATIDRIEILLNGQVVMTLDGDDLAVTPFGLRFEADLSGLSTNGADNVVARVVTVGPNPITVATNIVIAQNVVPPGGSDTVRGGAGDDLIQGNGGDDNLFGDGGDDFLAGGAGNDSLSGGAGSDTVDFFEELESVSVDLVAQTATGAQTGVDTLASIENARGGRGDDTLAAGYFPASDPTLPNGSVLEGGEGDDLLIGNRGSDTLNGGAGFDIADFSGAPGPVTVNIGTGSATASGDGADRVIDVEGVIGTAFADIITGGEEDNLFRGGGGGDLLEGGDGYDTADYSTSSAGVTVRLYDGFTSGGDAQGDLITSIERLVGSAFADTLVGSDSAVADTLEGGAGDDLLVGRNGGDILIGGDGDDQQSGGWGADMLNGGTGDDTLDGGAGDDELLGGAGVDAMDGGDGVDNLNGGAGADQMSGGLGDDILQGGSEADTLNGGDGADLLQGGTHDDVLRGEDGDDNLNGGAGADTMIGAAGSDTVSYLGATVAVSANLATGAGAGGWAQGDVFVGIENLYGSNKGDELIGSAIDNVLNGAAGDDRLVGGLGADTLQGGAGDDRVLGGDGANLLYGGDGDDEVVGGADADLLNGGDGNDLLQAGGGADTLTGGAGNDVLQGGTGNDSLNGGAGNDVLNGGDGNDRFIFTGNWGQDTATTFTAGPGAGDVIFFSTGQFGNLASVLAATVDDGAGNCVISYGSSTLKLIGVTKSQLRADDFDFTAAASFPPSDKVAEPFTLPPLDDMDPLVLPTGLESKAGEGDTPVVCPPSDAGPVFNRDFNWGDLGLDDFQGRDPHQRSVSDFAWIL